jgi:hypothetical protein
MNAFDRSRFLLEVAIGILHRVTAFVSGSKAAA